MKWALRELQVLQLAAPRLQVVDFLLQLFEELFGFLLSFQLPLLELLDELNLLPLDGGDQHAADLRTALNRALCDPLLIKII